jgi:4-hydroxythreonine-4-phosphate dehydrogenase
VYPVTDVTKPRIALTVGDPAGIGPEIVDKAAHDPRVLAVCDPIIYGSHTACDGAMGVPSALSGRLAYETLVRAVEDAQADLVDAVVTAPVSKLAFSMAGFPWKGHTDLLAHLTGTPRVAMMFWSEPLKVVLATIHIPLSDVPAALTRDALEGVISLTARELPRFGGPTRPRLAMAGLNPHAGENGVIGDEEMLTVRPALAAARALGIEIEGPFPSDTVFLRASRGEFDAVIACYHDQGLIPVKLLAFGQSVNVTLGLPIIRTSVDHGTAFDIAGQGKANAGSMVEATLLAARLALVR